MTDKKLVRRGDLPGASVSALPSLPASSGKRLGSRTKILAHDAIFVRTHADFLRARAEQSDAMRQLIESRIGVARVMAKLATLGEIAEHEVEVGRAERQHERRLLAIKHETEEVAARTILAQAQAQLAEYAPHGDMPSGATAARSLGLSPEEVEELLQTIPELSPETLHTLSLLLKGRLKEKNG